MRITYRAHGGNRVYWNKRWDVIPADVGRLNLDRYPGRYADRVAAMTKGRILEAGCGAGRVLLHYHRRGREIVGMDFIPAILRKIRAGTPGVPLAAGDALALPFADKSFAAVLAFGLYHNLERGFDAALRETRRVLEDGGVLCASLRADNLQNRIGDWMESRKTAPNAVKQFHKANYSLGEIRAVLRRAGFAVAREEFVENMPFLYKFAAFRHKTHRPFDEHVARAEGYRLSALGRWIQNALIALFPAAFCNIFVVTAVAEAPKAA